MDNILLYNILVSSVSKSLAKSKVSGKLELYDLHLLSLFGKLLNDFDATLTLAQKNSLEEAIRTLQNKNAYICNTKDYTSGNVLNTAPVISNTALTISESDYTFTATSFTANYTDLNSNAAHKLKILSLPTNTAILKYNDVAVNIGDEILLSNISKLHYVRTDNTASADSLTYKIYDSNSNNPLLSNSASLVITVNEIIPVSTSTANDIAVSNVNISIPDAKHSFGTADFLSSVANPILVDDIKIISLPANGTLYYMNTAVSANDIYNIQEVAFLNYTRDNEVDTTDALTFKINTKDNSNFSTTTATANLSLETIASVSTPVNNISAVSATSEEMTYYFSTSDFSTSSTDTINNIKINTLPANGVIYYFDEEIEAGEIFKLSELSNLRYVRDNQVDTTDVFTFSLNTSFNATYTSAVNFSLALSAITVVSITDNPLVLSDIAVSIDDDKHPFSINDFLQAVSADDLDKVKTIMITNLPTEGQVSYHNTLIEVNETFNNEELLGIVYTWLDYTTGTDTIGFKINTITNETYSNMATMTININASVNLKPSQVGALTLNIANSTTHVFTQANFTTETTPVYLDPEGDNPEGLKVTLLPSTGSLKLNGIDINTNDIVTFTDINAGNFIYVGDAGTQTIHVDTFNYSISDVGSSEFTTGGVGTINVAAYVNQSPTVGDGITTIDEGNILTFTKSMFTSSTVPPYDDPEGDVATNLRVTVLPSTGSIKLNGTNIIANQVIPFSSIDSGLLTYVQAASAGGSMPNFDFDIQDSNGNWSN